MRILIVGSYRGGYRTIIDGLASEMTKVGVKVDVLGVFASTECDGYNVLGTSDWSVVPVKVNAIKAHLAYDRVLLVSDIPIVIGVGNAIGIEELDVLFPVESDPILSTWAKRLTRARRVYTFTDFGYLECQKAGINCKKIGVGVSEFWSAGSKSIARLFLGLPENSKVILTVADNQERKALSIGLAAVATVMGLFQNALYLVVTGSAGGWDIDELARYYGIDQNVRVVESAQTNQRMLREYYRAADVLLSTSLAEGVGLPLYEAQACGCPIVAVNSTSIVEAVKSGRLVDYSFVSVNPWGNTRRYWPEAFDVAEVVFQMLDKGIQSKIKFPTWKGPAQRLLEAL